MTADTAREALRQQQLLRALWRREGDAELAPWLHERGARAAAGLAAYRGNAAAIAERALAAAFPTVQQLVGTESFAPLARAYWHAHPPQRGDLAWHGEALADWIAADAQLATEPYLADVARIDWAVHRIEHAGDVAVPPPGLQRLADLDPAELRLRLRPGLTMQRSRWPVVTLWQSHRRHDDDADRLAPVRAALASGAGETALVARPGWAATVQAIDDASGRFFAALQRGAALSRALDGAGASFGFDRWLRDALAQGWLQAVELLQR